MSESPAVISIKNLVKKFGNRTVLNNISLEILRGEVFVIMGGSGSGKSTLLRIMTGAIRPDSGNVYFNGLDMQSFDEAQWDKIKKCFGMSFQSAALLDFLTVEENVSLPICEHTNLDPKIIRMMARLKLSLVGLDGFEAHMPNELSGGMKKRVGLARAIAMDPEIVFYDEPTAGLDPIVCAAVDLLILDLTRKLNLTSIVVTHNMESVFRIADRIAMVYQGNLLQVGTPDEIRNSSNEAVQQFINGRLDGPIQLPSSTFD